MKVFKEIIAYFSHMNNKKRTLVWYIVSRFQYFATVFL